MWLLTLLCLFCHESNNRCPEENRDLKKQAYITIMDSRIAAGKQGLINPRIIFPGKESLRGEILEWMLL